MPGIVSSAGMMLDSISDTGRPVIGEGVETTWRLDSWGLDLGRLPVISDLRNDYAASLVAWWCGMIPTMLKVEPLLRSQVKTPKWGDAASESLVSTIVTLDPEARTSNEGVL